MYSYFISIILIYFFLYLWLLFMISENNKNSQSFSLVLNYSQSWFFKVHIILWPHPSPRSRDDGRRGGKREKSVGEMESRAAARPFKSDGDDRRRPATSAIRRGTTNVLSPVIGIWKDKRVQCNYLGLNRRPADRTRGKIYYDNAVVRARSRVSAMSGEWSPLLFSRLHPPLPPFYRSIIPTKCEISFCEKIVGRFIYLSSWGDTLAIFDWILHIISIIFLIE